MTLILLVVISKVLETLKSHICLSLKIGILAGTFANIICSREQS